MIKLTTEQAFAHLLFDAEVYQTLTERQKSSFRALRKRAKENEVTLDKMEEFLAAHGYVVVQEKLWTRK